MLKIELREVEPTKEGTTNDNRIVQLTDDNTILAIINDPDYVYNNSDSHIILPSILGKNGIPTHLDASREYFATINKQLIYGFKTDGISSITIRIEDASVLIFRSSRYITYNQTPTYCSTQFALPLYATSHLSINELLEIYSQLYEVGYDTYSKDWEATKTKVTKYKTQICDDKYQILNESSPFSITLKINSPEFCELASSLHNDQRYFVEIIYQNKKPKFLRMTFVPNKIKDKFDVQDELTKAEACVNSIQVPYHEACPQQAFSHLLASANNQRDFLMMFYEQLQNE